MTTMHERPSLQAMVKAAMSGSSNALQVNIEASRQSTMQTGSTKTASAKVAGSKSVETAMVHKLASAIEHIADLIVKEAEGPGEGPGALTVMESNVGGGPILEGGDSGQATAGNQPPKTPALQADKVQEGNAGTGLETNDEMSHPEQPVEPIKNASGLEASNRERLLKVAKEQNPEGHHLRRALLGNATSAAIEAEKGHKLKSFGKALRHEVKENLKGTAIGGAGGAALGAGIGALAKGKTGLKGGAFTGLGIGANVGGIAGAIKGRHDAEASRIHGEHSKHKKASVPVALIRKLAEDAINPASIDAPKGQDPMSPPEGASASGEGVPSEPSDVSSQKAMIASNEAAINYTKGQAKADPKKDVNQVLNEPALSAAHDRVLNEAFVNTGAAGVKISSAKTAPSVTKVAAQRVVLNNLLKRASADAQKGQ
jgi:hypothetical protein